MYAERAAEAEIPQKEMVLLAGPWCFVLVQDRKNPSVLVTMREVSVTKCKSVYSTFQHKVISGVIC